jgi:hypothetical protein
LSELGDIQRKVQDQLKQNSSKMADDFIRTLNQAWNKTPEAKLGKVLADAVQQQLNISPPTAPVEAKLQT